MASNWLTASEIAAAALPGLPLTVLSIDRMAEAEGWRRLPGKTCVADPGRSDVIPGRGVMRMCPVSVCHHVSTIGHRL